MNSQYAAWIARFTSGCSTLGKCHLAAVEMVSAFPELRLARGHVNDAHWGKRGHFWCVAPDGAIVDPTASQFPALMEYEEWKSGDEVRVGRCMNCGEDIWRPMTSLDQPPNNETFCDDDCYRDMARSCA